MKILIFGNPLLPNDSLPIRLIPQLQKAFPQHQFIHIDPSENLEDYGPHLTIIDTIQDIKEIKILKLKSQEDFKKIILPKSLSMHDFDLSINLRLLKKLDKIKSVKIIGIPMNITESKIMKKFIKSKYLEQK
ncbi:hypothetical protein HNV12_01885 [Methanococcoides sp. SA1]|nr:hypothetical protein [Methanococcoides sp. SA1]